MRYFNIKRIAFTLALVLLLGCFSCIFTACQKAGDTSIYTMVFYTGSDDSPASQVDPIREKAGETITKPQDPSYPGFRFGGWYTDYDKWTEAYTDFSKMPASNTILYAKWEAVGEDEKQAYENTLNETSQEGHLYIHYKRFNNDAAEYELYNLWVWPKAFTGIPFDWVRDAEGNIIVDELGGATCDIDLTGYYDNAGNSGTEVTTFLKTITSASSTYNEGDILNSQNYTDIYIGFLVVLESSKAAVDGMWVSDGGNQFIPKAGDTGKTFADRLRDGGYMHIFITQEHVYDFAYSIMDVGEMSDPYENDDGTNVSVSNLNSSAASTYPVQDTATGINGVGYQIMVASFADSDGDGYGDIRGIIDNLDYLESLNVDVLWLTPIQLSDSYHGYDTIDYLEVDPKFGTLDTYKELLRLTEEKGMKVIMDLVLNHTSINNVWFQKSSQLDPEYRSYYQWKNHEIEQLSNSWHKYGERCYSYYGKFSTSMPELNYDYQPTRDAIVDVAKYWLGLGVDGFRIDAVKHIYMEDEVTPSSTDIIIRDYDASTNTDYSSNVTKNLNFFREFNARIKEEFPDAYIVGENFDGHAYNVAPYYEGLDSMLNFYAYFNFSQICDFQAASPKQFAGSATAQGTFNGVNIDRLRTNNWSFAGTSYVYDQYRQGDAIDALFTSNHDVSRLINNVLGEGNLAVTAANQALAMARAKVIMATVMSLPGVSYIYYGDELGMTGNFSAGETKLSPHIDRRYRQPFKWTTANYNQEGGSEYITHYSISGDATYYVEWDNYNTTLAGAAEQAADTNSFLNYVKKWTSLKSNDDVIKYGTYEFLSSNDGIFAYKLTYDGVTYYCYHNFTQNGISNYINGGSSVVLADDEANSGYLPPYASIILKD